MPELRLFPLEEVLGPAEIDKLSTLLHELGVDEVPVGDDAGDLEEVLSETQLDDFNDKLEAHDIACNIYLPAEFEGQLEIGDFTVGSAYVLAEALEELRDELDIDEDDLDFDEDDEEHQIDMMERELSYAWRVFMRAAASCTSRQVPLHVIP